MIVPFIFLYPAFLFNKVGAADIKLIMIEELIAGPLEFLNLFICVCVCGVIFLSLFFFIKKDEAPFAVAIFGGSVLFVIRKII